MEANDASLVSGDATSRAQELRANLGARQVAETLLAEAGKIRQDAALAADALVEEAQQLSAQLVAESKQAAEQIAGEARERADGVLTRARIEAEEITGQARVTADALRSAAEAEIEDYRRRVRAEVTAQVTQDLTEQHRAAEAAAREQSEALVSDLEASVRILGVSLESAMSNVSELLGSLEALRPTAGIAPPAVDETPTARQDPPADSTGARYVDTHFGLEPAGPAAPSVPTSSSPFGTDSPSSSSSSAATVAEADEPDPDRPRSATEAFLSSSSMEIEQASRELRDLQHPEDARRRRSDESRRAAQRRELDAGTPDDTEEQEPTDESRPLGWLFRTAQ